MEEPQETARNHECQFVERPRQREQSERDEGTQRARDAPVAGEQLHSADEPPHATGTPAFASRRRSISALAGAWAT